MCGISSIIYFDKKETPLLNDIVLMCNAIKHRGPDDEGYLLLNSKKHLNISVKENKNDDYSKIFKAIDSDDYSFKGYLAFGFRRLSILDLSIKGHQPMSYLGRYWIIFNGEIYNYFELKQELLNKGYSFFSNTDTEVILAAYDMWGVDCLNKFNGMWAFIIFDTIEEKLFISRDRFGVKPLYYYLDNEKIVSCSEIKGIISNSKIETQPNYHYINEFLRTYPKEFIKETSFDSIFKFPKSSFVEIKLSELRNFESFITQYYKLKFNTERVDKLNDLDKLKSQFYTLLEDSVRLRLSSDVDVGTSLSGGLDSSFIAFLINKINNKKSNQKTFSLVFDKSETIDCDESNYINEIIQLLKVNSYKINPSLKDVENEYIKTIYAMEQPQDDMLLSCMFTYKLYNKNGVRVAIDGQGADEILAGYLRYLVNYFTNLKISSIFREVKRFSVIPGTSKEIIIGLLFNLCRVFHLQNQVRFLLVRLGKFKDPFISPAERMYDDFVNNLENLLHYGDRSSMYYSVESRFPFLDYRLVEFLMNLPYNYKIHNGWTKYIARLSFQNELPTNIVWRKDKMGWEIPQRYWFNKLFKDKALTLMLNSEIVNYLKLRNTITKNWGKINKSNKAFKQILKIYNLTLWYELFIKKSINIAESK